MLIAAILDHYGSGEILYRPGWSAVRCPFHEDTTASASLNIDEGAFKCHGCSMKGDAIALVMIAEDLSNREDSIEYIKSEIGVSDDEIRKARGRSSGVPGRKTDPGKGRPLLPPGRG